MKKLLVFALAAGFGLLANAAMINWGADVVGDGQGGEAPDGWIAYFIEADSNAAGIAALENSDLSFLGSYTAETDGGEIAGSIKNLGNGVTKTGYMVVFNSDDAASATHAYVTGVSSASTTALGGSGFMNWDIETATASYDNWVKVGGDAPEPTSGLLLLVGGAMLALRRKQKK